jgi:MmyB-like transcription regulator ligand binding domain
LAVLVALSDALRLSPDERRHAAELAASAKCAEFCPKAGSSRVHSTTRQLLDRLDPTPAFIVDHVTDVLAWNSAFDRLMRTTPLLDAETPNLLRFTFLQPASRRLYRDWSATAHAQVGALRAASSRPQQRDEITAIADELRERSEEFARLWATHDVGEQRRGILELLHPVVGPVDVEFEVLIVSDPSEHRLVIYLPADEASAIALDRAVTAARDLPALRVIQGGA